MRTRVATSLLTGLLSLTLVLAGCGDDDTDLSTADDPVDTSGSTSPTPDGSGGSVPDAAPDLVGTITSVTPFEPVTEDCIPAEDLDPDGSVSSDDPPICTPEGNDVVGTVLVEERPDEDMGGRKISYTVTTDTALSGETAEGTPVRSFDDLAEGQLVESWVPADGACAESYPEQCGAAAIRVTG